MADDVGNQKLDDYVAVFRLQRVLLSTTPISDTRFITVK